MDINARVGLLFVLWLVVVAVTALAIGPERKRKWFRLRDTSRSLFNRRGMFGELMQFGVPRTTEGWLIFAGFLAMIVISGYLVI